MVLNETTASIGFFCWKSTKDKFFDGEVQQKANDASASSEGSPQVLASRSLSKNGNDQEVYPLWIFFFKNIPIKTMVPFNTIKSHINFVEYIMIEQK